MQGGGLLRSLGGWQAVAALRRGREAYRGDERILGRSAFVEQLQQAEAPATPGRGPRLPLDALTARVCRQVGLGPVGLEGGGRHGAVARARAGIAYLWVEGGGHPARPLAPVLGVSPQAVYQAVARGRVDRAMWERLLKTDLGRNTFDVVSFHHYGTRHRQ